MRLYLESECDLDGGFRGSGNGDTATKAKIELYNKEDEDGERFLEFTSLCLEVQFFGSLTYSDSFATNANTLEVSVMNPNNQRGNLTILRFFCCFNSTLTALHHHTVSLAEYYNDRIFMKDATNLDAVKIEYRKVTARSSNLGWTPARDVTNEIINFKFEQETIYGIATAIWDISTLPDYEYEVRLKSECMESKENLPLNLRQYYSDPM